jgi:hypothetical protein
MPASIRSLRSRSFRELMNKHLSRESVLAGTGLAAPSPKQPGRLLPRPGDFPCTCPGNEVPFDCPRHGAVENPNWPLLKQAKP